MKPKLVSPAIYAIPSFPGYGVSRDGRVWTCKNARHGFLPYWKPLSPGLNGYGYLVVAIMQKGKRVTCKVHKLVALTFLGDPTGLDVNHVNGVRTDNRLSNLEYVTRSYNLWDARKRKEDK